MVVLQENNSVNCKEPSDIVGSKSFVSVSSKHKKMMLTEVDENGARAKESYKYNEHEKDEKKSMEVDSDGGSASESSEDDSGESDGSAVSSDQSEGNHRNVMLIESDKEKMKRSEELWKSHGIDSETPRCKAFGGRTEKLLLRAKKNHRTDISYKSWGKYEYYKRWGSLKRMLSERTSQNIPKIYGPSYDLKRFREEFEYPCKPCLISGLCDDWRARKTWNFEDMRENYGERHFKCGEDDDGYSIRVKLKHFFRYQSSRDPGGAKLDDSPLYIFEPNFDEDRVLKNVLKEYSVPHLFKEDLFSLVGEDTRPPYRWLLFGPERSGSCIHTDPLGSSAWNALVQGRKLWVCFPPHLKKRLVKGKDFINYKEEDDEAIDWFVNILPRILDHGGEELKNQMISFVQHPGETVFVPTDWWHSVLNLDDTIAVTQNFCSSGNFDAVWRSTRTGRTRMAGKWINLLKTARPDLYERAVQLDKQDDFDLPARIAKVIEKRRLKKERKRQRKLERLRRKNKGEMGDEEMETSSSSESSSSDDD